MYKQGNIFTGIKPPETVYIAAAVVLLPINSALNPIIYSNFSNDIYEKSRAWIKQRRTKYIRKPCVQNNEERNARH